MLMPLRRSDGEEDSKVSDQGPVGEELEGWRQERSILSWKSV